MTEKNFEPGQKQAFQREAISLAPGRGAKGPFSLDDEDAYARWRDAKLAGFPKSAADLVIEVKDTSAPSSFEREAIRDRVRLCNMALYVGPALADVEDSKDQVCALGRCFGLHSLDKNPYADEDAITPLHVAAGAQCLEAGRKMYIPYTSKAINWHTDGYYNTSARRIRAMVLHCVRPAGTAGGQNALFDPEMIYLLMREHDPDMVAALCADEAMTIPGNDMDDDVNRGDVTGPVFSLNRADGSLYMRYTTRKRNIIWAEDAASQKAVTFIHDILADGGPGEPYIFRHTMKSGEGLICNNVLHTRTGFEDGGQGDLNRMMLRARYIERIEGTACLI